MADYPLGPWRPDLRRTNSEHVTNARGCIHRTDGFTEIPRLVAEGDALPGRAIAAVNVLSAALAPSTFAATDEAIFRYDFGSWTDISRAGGYVVPQEEVWDTAVWKDAELFMATRAENVQKFEVGIDALFSDLFEVGSTFKPRPKSLAVVGEHLMMVNVNEATLGNHPARVWWCAQGDPTKPDPDIQLQAGFRDIPGDIGELQRIFGWDYAIIFSETSMYRANYIGGDVQWDIQLVEPERGLMTSTAAVQSGRRVYYLSADGFYVTDGLTSAPVGANKINEYFLERITGKAPWAVSAQAVPRRRLIIFALTTTGDQPNEAAILSEDTGEWTWIDQGVDVMFQTRGAATDLDIPPWDTRDLDDSEYGPINLDSSVFSGGLRTFGAIDAAHRFSSFVGLAYDAEIETGDLQPFPGRRTYIKGVRPLVEGGIPDGVTLQVGTRDTPQEPIMWSADFVLNDAGKFTFEVEGRYIRFRLKIEGGFDSAFMLQTEDNQGDLQPAGAV